jgi:hypothetical protein
MFQTTKPPTIPASTSTDNSYSRLLKVGKLESLPLELNKTIGLATLDDGVKTIADVPGLETGDIVFVGLHSLNSSTELGVQYIVTINPPSMTITSYASDGTVADADNSIVKYMVVKPVLS